MDFKSVADLLHFAISKEQASKQFYLDLASQMKDVTTQSIFQTIAKQEEKHEEALKLEVIKQGYTLPLNEDDSAQSSEYQWQEHLELDENGMHMNYTEALMLAIQKERAAFQLYTQLIAMTQELEFREMLLELAEEEMRHVIQFEREYDAVSH
ncbi:MAG: ferritin family protein [Phycisphaerae bacterium]|nr:ferritin family protein [Phycisphaerae bacterium]